MVLVFESSIVECVREFLECNGIRVLESGTVHTSPNCEFFLYGFGGMLPPAKYWKTEPPLLENDWTDLNPRMDEWIKRAGFTNKDAIPK